LSYQEDSTIGAILNSLLPEERIIDKHYRPDKTQTVWRRFHIPDQEYEIHGLQRKEIGIGMPALPLIICI